MRVSLPCVINEPLGALARMANVFNCGHALYMRAARHDNPVWRCGLALTAQCAAYSSAKVRKKKPFNAMLGETYECVGEDFLFLAEKVRHQPEQISCFCMTTAEY